MIRKQESLHFIEFYNLRTLNVFKSVNNLPHPLGLKKLNTLFDSSDDNFEESENKRVKRA